VPKDAIRDVEHAPPLHARRVNPKRVAEVQMVVDHRGEEVVRRAHGVDVPGEVEVHFVHRLEPRQPAAGASPF
jgi:hypothetical protein